MEKRHRKQRVMKMRHRKRNTHNNIIIAYYIIHNTVLYINEYHGTVLGPVRVSEDSWQALVPLIAALSLRFSNTGCLRWQCSRGGDAAKANMLLEYTGAVQSQTSTQCQHTSRVYFFPSLDTAHLPHVTTEPPTQVQQTCQCCTMLDVLKHCQYIFELQEKGMTSIRDSIQGGWYRFRNRADSSFY